MSLDEYKKRVASLSVNDKKLRDLYLRDLALGKIQGPPTGYASIDKPWLKYYSEEHINADLPRMTAYEYLKEMNKDNLDGIAFDTLSGILTFNDFFDIVERVASSLFALGIFGEKKVITMLPTLEHESFLLYGVDRVGSAISYLHPQTSLEDIVSTIKEFDSSILFMFDSLFNEEKEKYIYKNTNLKNIVVIGNKKLCLSPKTITWKEFLEKGIDVELPLIKKDPSELLFIAKTGGSTGKPKNVMLSDDSFNNAVNQYLNSDLPYDQGDRWLRLWPLFSATAAVSNNHLPLCAGMNNIIRPFPLDINEFDKVFFDVKPHHLLLIPQLLDVLEQSNLLFDKDLSFVKTNGCGGLSITSQFEERVNNFHKNHNMNCILGYGWGCTENATSAAMRSNLDTTIIGTVGAPQVFTTVSVFDPDTLEEKTYDAEGELCILSPTIMLGYWNDNNLTSNVLKKHEDGKVWLHTGDLGSISKEGIVTVKGRMTRTIFVFPMAKLYPSYLEDIISKVDGVNEVVVGDIPDLDHQGFSLPVCFIVANQEKDENEIKENINEICNSVLPEYAQPNSINFIDEFPRTISDKVDVRKLCDDLMKTKNIKKIKAI